MEFTHITVKLAGIAVFKTPARLLLKRQTKNSFQKFFSKILPNKYLFGEKVEEVGFRNAVCTIKSETKINQLKESIINSKNLEQLSKSELFISSITLNDQDQDSGDFDERDEEEPIWHEVFFDISGGLSDRIDSYEWRLEGWLEEEILNTKFVDDMSFLNKDIKEKVRILIDNYPEKIMPQRDDGSDLYFKDTYFINRQGEIIRNDDYIETAIYGYAWDGAEYPAETKLYQLNIFPNLIVFTINEQHVSFKEIKHLLKD